MNEFRILIADDDEALRETLGEVLVRLGFEVIEAGNGREALELARRKGPALSILDFHMPGLNGLEILRAMQAGDSACQQDAVDHQDFVSGQVDGQRALPVLPCIMVSAEASPAEQLEALDQGAFRFLEKPFSVDQILSSVWELFESLPQCMPGSFPFPLAGPVRDGECSPVPLRFYFPEDLLPVLDIQLIPSKPGRSSSGRRHPN